MTTNKKIQYHGMMPSRRIWICWLTALLVLGGFRVHAETNGAALLPPMGYNSWYANGTSISEGFIENIADQMATNGLQAAGYQYINLDDGWAGYRDTNGVMVADTNKFPHGMKAVADYIHAKGFKFGLYTVGGNFTCAGYPGSEGYEVLDANTYASWGVDYVKFEGCNIPWWELFPHEQTLSLRMEQALLHTGRPIVFSLSIGYVENWIPTYCNVPRDTGDFNGAWASILSHIDTVAGMPFKSRQGMWNDPDVLYFLGFSTTEDTSIFSMWCELAAPLITPTMNPDAVSVMTNAEAIAVDQDAAGIQGVCVSSNNGTQVWCKPLGATNSGTLAVVLFNRGENATNITANWSDLGLSPTGATVRDLWAHAALGNYTNSYSATIPAHGVQMLKISGIPAVRFGTVALAPGGMVFNGSGGASNGTYFVLMTTNPGTPAGLWKVVATNRFDANGNFLFTNPVNTGVTGNYFRLGLP